MADFDETNKSLALTLTGSIQTAVTGYKGNFFILNKPSNSGNIQIYAGDNNILIWELAPGDSFEVSDKVVNIVPGLGSTVPLKVNGTASDQLLGFKA